MTGLSKHGNTSNLLQTYAFLWLYKLKRKEGLQWHILKSSFHFFFLSNIYKVNQENISV